MKTGIELIAEERERQIEQEGWSAGHDDSHDFDEIAFAAACYAMPHRGRDYEQGVPIHWMWEDEYWKPTPEDRVRELTKAGALIAAEIDRIQRSTNQTGE